MEKRIDKTKSNIWNSIDQALSLDLTYNYIIFNSTSLIDGIDRVRIYKRPKKNYSCGNMIDVQISFVKTPLGWKIERFELSGYD